MLLSRSLGIARSAALLRTPAAYPRVLAIRPPVAPRAFAFQPVRRWNHGDQSGSGKRPPTSKFPDFPKPPKDETAPKPSDIESSETKPFDDAPEIEPQSSPKRPLPDLRQGLPSTFEAEFLKEAKEKPESTEHDIDITDAEPKSKSGGGGGRGDIPKSAYESSIDRRRNKIARLFYISLATAALLGAAWAGREWEDEESERAHPDAPSGWGVMLWYKRIQARIKDQLGYYTEPTFPKLLPDKTGQLEQQLSPYTLVLSLEDLLVHEEWTRDEGWRIAKRPGVDFFLMYLSRHYELCIFTSVPMAMADPIIKKLDPYHFVWWPLFREATRYDNGDHVKDLAYLNRPLDKVILLDTKASHAKAQPENSIILPPWKGDPNDRDLLALIPFLEYIPMFGVNDVRDVIKSFEGQNIPVEFARREKLMREKVSAASKSKLSSYQSSSSGGFLGKLTGSLGMKQQSPQAATMVGTDGIPINLLEEMAQGKTIFDIYREQSMRDYKFLEKQIKENGEKWLQEEAELIKKMEAEEMKKMKGSFFGMFSGGSNESGTSNA